MLYNVVKIFNIIDYPFISLYIVHTSLREGVCERKKPFETKRERREREREKQFKPIQERKKERKEESERGCVWKRKNNSKQR